MRGIADTGFLVASASRNDLPHGWAVRAALRVTEPFLRYESVLSEAAFPLSHAQIVLASVREGLVAVALDCNDPWQALEERARRYANRQPEVADLCSIRLRELHPGQALLTTGRRGFPMSRRDKRHRIPLLGPPAT